MATLTDRTDLELFFNPLLAGNAPQGAPTAMLFELVVSLTRLIDCLDFIARNAEGTGKETALKLLNNAREVELTLRKDQSRATYLSLISFLSSIIAFIKTANQDTPPTIDDLKAKSKKVLISLVLLARESDDTALKNDVLSLAKRWE